MKSFEERLEAESGAWVTEGLIAPAQREALLARHPAGEGGGHRFMAVLATIGGVLFAVGVSLVIKSNWEYIGDWTKIGGLVLLLVGFYWLGWRLKISPGAFPRTGEVFLTMGAIFFLLGIALVSQIYHLDRRPANGVLLWWAGIAALPWLTRSRGVQLLSLVAGVTWLGMELEARDSWLRLAGDASRWHNHEYLFAAAGVGVGAAIFLSGLALRGGESREFAGLHEKVGLLLLCVSLYALGFAWSTHGWSHYTMMAARWQPAVFLGAMVGAAGAWAWTRRSPEIQAMAGWLALAAMPAGAHLAGVDLGDSGWLWGGVACVALFLFNLAMIRTGLATGHEAWINLGMAGIALNIVTRYFLLFGSMLEGGVFFIVTGLLVLALGYFLERKRRALVGTVRQEAAT